jgi:hypothetical protein
MTENDRNKSTLNIAIGAMGTLKSKADQLFKDGFTIINNTINIDNEIITELNKSRIGTFQGLARQTVVNEMERKKKENEKNGIYNEPEEDDDVAQAVLEQPYNEREDINRTENRGGRKRKTNKKYIKNIKKYKKSRKNKYKY